jgi:hypothetical protein
MTGLDSARLALDPKKPGAVSRPGANREFLFPDAPGRRFGQAVFAPERAPVDMLDNNNEINKDKSAHGLRRASPDQKRSSRIR